MLEKNVRVKTKDIDSNDESIKSGSDSAHALPILLCESLEDSDDTIMDVKLAKNDTSMKENNKD